MPPLGHGPGLLTGILHDLPWFVTAQSDAACARSISGPSDAGLSALLRSAGPSPATIAEFMAPKSSVEIACACACEIVTLWLDPPQGIEKSESRISALVAQAIRTLEFPSMHILPRWWCQSVSGFALRTVTPLILAPPSWCLSGRLLARRAAYNG